eukprot:scaffold99579_cov40-Phaeocystis_antarctica.AAC.1
MWWCVNHGAWAARAPVCSVFQLVLRSAALLACCCYWAHELFAAQKRCDVRLAVLSRPNLTNVSSLEAPSHRGSMLQLGTQVVHTVSQTVTAGLARCEPMAAVLVALVRLG